MKRKKVLLATAAMLLVLGTGIGSAMAYFTTYVAAEGGKIIHLGDTTTFREPEVSEQTKHLVVDSAADSEPVWVRARAMAGSQYTLEYSSEKYENGSDSWYDGGDGYYYYGATGEDGRYHDTVLYGGQSTRELLVKISNIPADADDFNVIVVYECTPVVFDTDGAPMPADWSRKLTIQEVTELEKETGTTAPEETTAAPEETKAPETTAAAPEGEGQNSDSGQELPQNPGAGDSNTTPDTPVDNDQPVEEGGQTA